jgi:hypothetical protein
MNNLSGDFGSRGLDWGFNCGLKPAARGMMPDPKYAS